SAAAVPGAGRYPYTARRGASARSGDRCKTIAHHLMPNAVPTLSGFATGLTAETAFDVLAVAKRLKAQGKDVIELQIGASPFPTTHQALAAGIRAIHSNATHYCASSGLPDFKEIIAAT